MSIIQDGIIQDSIIQDSVIQDPSLARLLAELHSRSDAQVDAIKVFERELAGRAHPPTDEEVKQFRRDKLVALDRGKAEFCYQLCRATDARRIVEVGTSHGVSTLYLAAALRDNIAETGGDGLVIGTEYEPEKAAAASTHFDMAGLSQYIELRQGDLRETLRDLEGPIDVVLVDIWIGMARPALELVAPHLRPGAAVVCDNTEVYRRAYSDYFAFLHDPANGFQTMTLPFRGGLEMSVRRRA
jgi:predicted O-methyltransferase YrrM